MFNNQIATTMTKAKANLNREGLEVHMGNDAIVIVRCLADLPGGRTLDVSGLPADTKVVKAGHIIISDGENWKPMPINAQGNGYASTPSGSTVVGVLKMTVTTEDPRAAIMTQGQVNAAASPYPVTTTIKNALPRIEFLYA